LLSTSAPTVFSGPPISHSRHRHGHGRGKPSLAVSKTFRRRRGRSCCGKTRRTYTSSDPYWLQSVIREPLNQFAINLAAESVRAQIKGSGKLYCYFWFADYGCSPMARKRRVHCVGALYHVMCWRNQGGVEDPAVLSRGLGKLAEELARSPEPCGLVEMLCTNLRKSWRPKRSIKDSPDPKSV